MADPSKSTDVRSLPYARWICLTVLLLAEVLAIGSRFDFYPLEEDQRWWSGLVVLQSHLRRLAIPGLLATLLFGGSRLRDELKLRHRQLYQARRTSLFLVSHLAAFAVYTWLTALVVEGNLRRAPWADAWMVMWIATGFATLLLWAATLLPLSLWLPVVRRASAPLAAGLVVGTVVLACGWLTQRRWEPLCRSTFWVVRVLLDVGGADVVCDASKHVIRTPSFAIRIAPTCSGYEGIGLIWAFTAAYLWFFRRRLRFPHALLLFPLGAGVVWVGNAVRIAALIGVGTFMSPEIAMHGFHSQAGWLLFNGISLGLVAGTQHFRLFSVTSPLPVEAGEPNPVEATEPNPVSPYLAPLCALLAAVMITGAFSSGFDALYFVRVLAVAAVLWIFRHTYAGWRWSWSWPAVLIGVAAFGLWLALEPTSSVPDADTALAQGLAALPQGWACAWLVFRVVGSVLTVPLAEELAFRGYLTRRLIATEFQDVPMGKFSWFSFLVSSALFGALHGRWLAGTIAGMLYAVAFYRRGQLSDAILAHATTNALIAVLVLTARTWSLWG